jgi:hypothetical protein
MTYSVFHRTWWRPSRSAPGGRVPGPGRKTYIQRGVATEAEARVICARWNDQNAPGPMSRKAEYTS